MASITEDVVEAEDDNGVVAVVAVVDVSIGDDILFDLFDTFLD